MHGIQRISWISWDPWDQDFMGSVGWPSSEPGAGGRRQGASALRIRRGCEAAYAGVQEDTKGLRSLPVKLTLTSTFYKDL